MTAALLLGAVGGAAVVLAWSALAPAPPPLGLVIERLHQPPPAPSSDHAAAGRLGRALERVAGPRLTSATCRDLRVVGMSEPDYLLRRVAWAAGALLGAPALAAVALALDLDPPVAVVAGAALVLGGLGTMVPPVVVRSGARARRGDFTYALSGYLDLVAVDMAGGRGVDQALESAAGAGGGWAFAELRRALARAQLHSEAPWDALDRLGSELCIPQLRDLAGSVRLAGTDGARITASIESKAKALRDHAQSGIEAEANAASELMSVALMVLLAGLVLFVGYPAAVSIVAGL